jgi:hypothetical protein
MTSSIEASASPAVRPLGFPRTFCTKSKWRSLLCDIGKRTFASQLFRLRLAALLSNFRLHGLRMGRSADAISIGPPLRAPAVQLRRLLAHALRNSMSMASDHARTPAQDRHVSGMCKCADPL